MAFTSYCSPEDIGYCMSDIPTAFVSNSCVTKGGVIEMNLDNSNRT
ncbi:MAG TPA: hypothetical protein GXX36_16595 [Clostridiaceae bacterium]|nr:hypothetical protein [Clostridiaceae bacterium]